MAGSSPGFTTGQPISWIHERELLAPWIFRGGGSHADPLRSLADLDRQLLRLLSSTERRRRGGNCAVVPDDLRPGRGLVFRPGRTTSQECVFRTDRKRTALSSWDMGLCQFVRMGHRPREEPSMIGDGVITPEC